MTQTTTPMIYERRQDETSRPYEAFLTYLMMGPQRSQRKVANVLGKSPTIICRWATKYQWRERAQAFDDERARAILATMMYTEAISSGDKE